MHFIIPIDYQPNINTFRNPAYCEQVSTSAVSKEGLAHIKMLEECRQHAEKSIALHGRLISLLNEVDEILSDFGEDNWDGYGALAVDSGAREAVGSLVRLLPDSIGVPEVSPTNKGYISLDWFHDHRQQLSMDMGADGMITYAWKSGSDCGSGMAQFDYKKIPAILDSCLDMVAAWNY